MINHTLLTRLFFLFLCCYPSWLFILRSFLVVSAGITSLGGVVDSANLDGPQGVVLVPDRKIALVTSQNLHKLSAYSYVDANNLVLLSNSRLFASTYE